MIVEQTIEARGVLARSPSFAMSLGAKELFHTNFLGFLLESDDEQLEDVRCALRDALCFPVGQGELSRCFVWREKKHLDLVLVPVASRDDSEEADAPVRTRALVVEAKLKSIPSWHQLERYRSDTLKSLRLDHDEKPNGFRVVLSTNGARSSTMPKLLLLAPTETEVHRAWTTASWSAVHDKLQEAASRLPADAPFATILRDYISALAALLQIITATRRFVTHACDTTDMTYGAYESELTRAELRRLRLHDLVGKLASDEWVRRLVGRVKEKLGADVSRGVLPYVHFSNSQPGFGLEISAPNGFQLGIQVQGGQLRRYVSCLEERADLEQRMMQPELFTGWFMQSVCGKPLTGLGRKGPDALTSLRCFNRKKFLYSALDLRSVKWQEAEAAILESAELALRKAVNHALWV